MKDAHEDALSPEALRRLERDTEGALDAWSDAALRDVEASRGTVTSAERAEAIRRFEQLARGPRRWYSRPAIRTLALAAALVVGLACGFVIGGYLRDAQPSGGPLLLGSDELFDLVPQGEVAGYTRFAWSTKSPGAKRFGLRVWNEDETEPAIVVDGLLEPSYTLSAEQAQLLGPRIYYEVVLQTEDRRGLSVASADAWLGSR